MLVGAFCIVIVGIDVDVDADCTVLVGCGGTPYVAVGFLVLVAVPPAGGAVGILVGKLFL